MSHVLDPGYFYVRKKERELVCSGTVPDRCLFYPIYQRPSSRKEKKQTLRLNHQTRLGDVATRLTKIPLFL